MPSGLKDVAVNEREDVRTAESRRSAASMIPMLEYWYWRPGEIEGVPDRLLERTPSAAQCFLRSSLLFAS